MKTITLRVDDNLYDLFKTAASGEKRTLSNFIEYAAQNYLFHESFVSDTEMDEIVRDKKLVASLQKGKEDVKKGRYKIVQ
jgi:predicted transcriptional regulator